MCLQKCVDAFQIIASFVIVSFAPTAGEAIADNHYHDPDYVQGIALYLTRTIL